jgi:hypothetical protein
MGRVAGDSIVCDRPYEERPRGLRGAGVREVGHQYPWPEQSERLRPGDVPLLLGSHQRAHTCEVHVGRAVQGDLCSISQGRASAGRYLAVACTRCRDEPQSAADGGTRRHAPGCNQCQRVLAGIYGRRSRDNLVCADWLAAGRRGANLASGVQPGPTGRRHHDYRRRDQSCHEVRPPAPPARLNRATRSTRHPHPSPRCEYSGATQPPRPIRVFRRTLRKAAG